MSANHYIPIPSSSQRRSTSPMPVPNKGRPVVFPPSSTTSGPQVIYVSSSYPPSGTTFVIPPPPTHPPGYIQQPPQRPRVISLSDATRTTPAAPTSASRSAPIYIVRQPSRHHDNSPTTSHYTLSPSSASSHYTPPGSNTPALSSSPSSHASRSSPLSTPSTSRGIPLPPTSPFKKGHRRYNSSTETHVRFADDPVQPSSPSRKPRRRGFFNRRGDQLLNNRGQFRPALDDDQYPPDLADYPEPYHGWMNEDGVRIDMRCRKISEKKA